MKIELNHSDGGRITIFSEFIMTIYDGGTYTQILLSNGSGFTVREQYAEVLKMLTPKVPKQIVK